MVKYWRYLIGVAYLVMGIVSWAVFHIEWLAAIFLALFGVFLYTSIRHGYVALAMKCVNDQKFDKAQEYLSITLNYNWLNSERQAFYSLAEGYIFINSNRKKEAAQAFEKALTKKFKQQTNKADIHLQLATMYGEMRQLERARIHLHQAKMMGVSSQVGEALRKIEKQLR